MDLVDFTDVYYIIPMQYCAVCRTPPLIKVKKGILVYEEYADNLDEEQQFMIEHSWIYRDNKFPGGYLCGYCTDDLDIFCQKTTEKSWYYDKQEDVEEICALWICSNWKKLQQKASARRKQKERRNAADPTDKRTVSYRRQRRL